MSDNDKHTIDSLRRDVDLLDDEIARLLCRRFELAKTIVAEKRLRGFAVEDRSREEEIIHRITANHSEHCAKMLSDVFATLFAQVKKN